MNALSKGKILVVDDDRLVLAMVVHGLAQVQARLADGEVELTVSRQLLL